MKKITMSAIALLAFTAAAGATDLPSKKTAPAAPAPVAEATATSNDSLTAAYGQDLENNFGAKTADSYKLVYTHNLGAGFTIGGQAQTSQSTANVLKQNLEAQLGYKAPAFYGVTLGGKLGIGERFVSTGNFPYYAIYGTADYKVMDKLTWNALGYRYRSAFDTDAYGYQSHRLSTGVTYDITPVYSVSAQVYRNFDTTTNFNATGDGFEVGLTAKF
jgi:hypothetical protein